jgi:hypothetical protein
MARVTADGMDELLLGIQPVFTGWRSGGAHASIPRLVQRLTGGRSRFARSCADFRTAREMSRALRTVSSPTIAQPLHTFDRELPRLQTLCLGLGLIPQLAGVGRPFTFLLAYQNSNELRATGGFIGSYGMVTLRDGLMSQRFSGTWAAMRNLSFPPPEPVQLYNEEAAWLFMDSNWSPSFPISAQLERYILRVNTGQQAEGVINVTPEIGADILSVLGPIWIQQYHRWVNASNIATLADYYANFDPATLARYAHLPRTYQTAVLRDNYRKQFLGDVARAVISRLNTLSFAKLQLLGLRLQDAIRRGDLLLYFPNHQVEELVRRIGADGSIAPTTSDYLYVVDTNLSYNKINPWVRMSRNYTVTIQPNRWLRSTLDLTFTNLAPDRLAPFSIGPGYGRLGGPLDYADYVRVYVPNGAELIDQSGWTQPWSSGGAYGKTIFSGYLIVPHLQTRTVHLEYISPPNVFTWSHGRKYRLVVPHQPGSQPRDVRITLSIGGRATRSWNLSAPRAQWSVTVPIPYRPFAPIPLAKQPGVVVAPGHWIEPYAYLAPPHR